MQLDVLTQSALTTAHQCMRKYFFAYELGLRPDRTDQKLRFGSIGHHGLDGVHAGQGDDELNQLIWKHAIENRDPYLSEWEFLIETHTLVALVLMYRWRWQESMPDVIETEGQFGHIVEPPYHRGDLGWGFSGKRDKLVRLGDDRVAIWDHKFLNQDLDDAAFWAHLTIDRQVSAYWSACLYEGRTVDTVVYDVVRKPTIKPFTATPMDKRKYTKDGALYKNQHAKDEEPAVWCARLMKHIEKNPDFYFARREVVHNYTDIRDFRLQLWQTTRQIGTARRHGYWFQNTRACLRPIRCAYFNLCTQHPWPLEQLPPEGFRMLEGWKHSELKEMSHDDFTPTTPATRRARRTRTARTGHSSEEGRDRHPHISEPPATNSAERSGGVGQEHDGSVLF